MRNSKGLSTIITILIVLGIAVLGAGGYFAYNRFFKKEPEPESAPAVKTVSIPDEILNNRFGFLGGRPEDAEMIKDVGGLWVRPHVGPFLWEAMQSKKDSEISFERTDKVVKHYQKEKVGILATLWPFADWDQKTKPNASKLKVSEKDEFLPGTNIKRKGNYLPRYRGNPNDWEAYKNWIDAVVERYDGDSIDDMPGLEIPIKYWEVMNEPDLTGPEGEEERLTFYKQDADDYAELLIKTYKAIKDADPDSKVLIAGAAGGNNRFLDFYRGVFKNKKAVSAFDIANVHCISNDSYQSFNVKPYKKMLEEFGIEKPIWVTEAEAITSDNPDINATQTLKSTKNALELGAEKIFFTRYEFEGVFFGDKKPPSFEDKPQDIEPEIYGKDPKKAYKAITSQ